MFSGSRIFAFSVDSLELLTDLTNQTELKDYPIKNLLRSYCNELLKAPPIQENTYVYNAQQSVFVYLLCRNIDSYSPYFKDQEKSYFKRLSFDELWFQSIDYTDGYSVDYCAPGSFQNECDLSMNIPKLFNGIMNDYINMKQPNLYGMNKNFENDTDIVGQINTFSAAYFKDIQVCSDKDPRYPKTCKMMKSYIKKVRNALSDVKILNASGILEMTKSKEKTVSCPSPVTVTGDIFYCGLYGDVATSLPSFVNLVYNELFFYRLFMWYYLSMLQTYPSLLSKNIYMRDYSDVAKTFSTQYMWSKDALSLSLRMMRDTYIAFPFHVGFSMYQEDLDGFGKSLARIAPPIYTLYDKLRNVQKPQ